MYYPYLRARQYELIALRELAREGALNDMITPVLEPLSDKVNYLNLANSIFHENGVSPFFLVNPLEGEDKGDHYIFLDYLSELENCSYRVAFHFNDNKKYIEKCITEYNLQDCMIIALDNYSNERQLKELCQNTNISHIMLFEPQTRRGLNNFIRGLEDKRYIRLDAPFIKVSPNSKYLPIQANKLSEENVHFVDDGFDGFADFTVLAREHIEGGGPAKAVVIHFTYINEDDSNNIWIRHFTSDSNTDTSNLQGKFAEAARKAVRFINNYEVTNSAATELKGYFTRPHFPGLPIVKKISIKNHLLIVGEYLSDVQGAD